jgi:predicted membrane protein
MADVLSLLVFFIYIAVILVTILYISPIISVLVMILIPFVSVYFLPEGAMQFLTINQFSFVEGRVLIQNIHILLMIWSAIIGIVVYTEIVSWYLLIEESPKRKKQELTVTSSKATPLKPEAAGNKAEGIFMKLGKIIRGRK